MRPRERERERERGRELRSQRLERSQSQSGERKWRVEWPRAEVAERREENGGGKTSVLTIFTSH